jgi:branched-chain amino acid transport system permease protein
MQLRPDGAFRMTNERSGLGTSRSAPDACYAKKAILDDAT